MPSSEDDASLYISQLARNARILSKVEELLCRSSNAEHYKLFVQARSTRARIEYQIDSLCAEFDDERLFYH